MTNNEKFAAIQTAGINGKFFSVRFIKRTNGEHRYMNCRLGVTKHLRGGTKAYKDADHALVTVYDVQAPEGKGYRSIPLESIYEINGVTV